MREPQRYVTKVGQEELNVWVVKIGELLYQATGEFRGLVIEKLGKSEIAAFGKWYKAAELKAKGR
ncbi:hypothetical protein [Vreelandella sp. EE27]